MTVLVLMRNADEVLYPVPIRRHCVLLALSMAFTVVG